MSIRADRVRSEGYILIASGNVRASDEGVEVFSNQLRLDSNQNRATANGRVVLKRGEDLFEGTQLFYDFDEDRYKIFNLRTTQREPRTSISHFLGADEVDAYGDEVSGQHAQLTTCTHEPPHYSIRASKFKMLSEQRIEGDSVLFSTTLAGVVPFGFWMPYYCYDIGKRNIVWNIPVFGKKQTPGWGWFMQNTIDYDRVRDQKSSFLFDIFEYKGLGLGFRHQYDLFSHDGTLSYYRLQELDTGRLNEKIGIKDRFDWLGRNVSWAYERADAERINTTGRQNYERRSVTIMEDRFGAEYRWHYADYFDNILNYATKRFEHSHRYMGAERYQFLWNERETLFTKRKDTEALLTHFFELPERSEIRTKFRYQQLSVLGTANNTLLESDFRFSHRLREDLSFYFWVDTMTDLDGEAIDNDLAFNRFFYRVPEMKLSQTLDLASWRGTQTLTLARYQEADFSSGNTFRVFPISSEFSDYGPNTLITSQRLDRRVGNLKTDGVFSAGIGYDQYLFAVSNRDFLNGDALYTLDGSVGYDKDWGGIISETSFKRVISPEEGRSPFLYFQKRVTPRQSLGQKLTFYGEFIAPFRWVNETAFDWEYYRFEDYRTRLSLYPDSHWVTSLSGGKRLSPGPFDFEQDFLITEFSSQLSHPDIWRFNYVIGFDTNEWVYRGQNLIQYSYLTFGFPFGDNRPEYRWEATMSMQYNTTGLPRGFDVSRYEFQTIYLTKRDHCQHFSLSYNRLSQEFGFKYTIDAFVDSPLELKANRQGIQFGGKLNAASEERF